MKKFTMLLLIGILAANCEKNSFKTIEDNDVDQAAWSMKNTLELPDETANYERTLPGWMIEMGMAADPVDNDKATIGRVLFYDKKLSSNGKIACASCHKQAFAFGDPKRFSTGVGGLTTRQSPALANSVTMSGHHAEFKGKKIGFFWDNRAGSIAEQSRQTFHNPIEMGISAGEAAHIVRENAYYSIIWRNAFTDFEPTGDQVLECLAEFVGAMGAPNSRFDKGMSQKTADLGAVTTTLTVFDTILVPAYYTATQTVVINSVTTYGNIFPYLTGPESVGKDIFIKNCSKCHSPVRTFQDVFEACIGLDKTYADNGIGLLTNKAVDNGVFVAPSLKNIALSAPYMHDGRFGTLAEVVDFYNEDIKPHPNLHPFLKDAGGAPKDLHLSYEEKTQLIAFLNTLTDEDTERDFRFADPFRQ